MCAFFTTPQIKFEICFWVLVIFIRLTQTILFFWVFRFVLLAKVSSGFPPMCDREHRPLAKPMFPLIKHMGGCSNRLVPKARRRESRWKSLSPEKFLLRSRSPPQFAPPSLACSILCCWGWSRISGNFSELRGPVTAKDLSLPSCLRTGSQLGPVGPFSEPELPTSPPTQ